MSAPQFPNAETTRTNARRAPFDSVTIGFHWATVLIVLVLFASAWLHSQSHNDALKATLLEIHRSLGLTIWVTTALRLIWRTTNAKLPPFPTDMTKMHGNIVRVSEYCLYALLLGQPVSGFVATLFSGHQFGLFGWEIPQLIPENATLELAFFSAHKLGAWGLGTLVAGHAAAALFHHFVLRDDVLECMAPVITTERHEQKFLPGHVVRNQYL
jgi:cytochrome b561